MRKKTGITQVFVSMFAQSTLFGHSAAAGDELMDVSPEVLAS